MKTKITLAGMALLCLLAACKKENTNINNPQNELGPIPASFKQRVMIEELTGEWCGACPYGASLIEQYKRTYGDSVVPVSIHVNDYFDISQYDPVTYSFPQNYFGFPCAAINRVPQGSDTWYSSGYWGPNIATQMQRDHQTGV
ncbi:MAG TPA: thioredoxin family protein, partial [Chitinophagales bacterium]|nr:thioredoxin family protein [Chitinophagales bacterium]